MYHHLWTADVKTLEKSILRFGLLSPLVASWQKGRLIIVDGRKRFAALRRLAFQGRLPATLKRIPYILANSEPEAPAATMSPLVRSETLLKVVSRRTKAGDKIQAVAKDLGLSSQSVRDLLCLSRLARPIQKKFHQHEISFEVAKAYSAIPSRTQQLILFHQLGKSASVPAILAAASVDHRKSVAA